MKQIRGKWALVTGAASGIGRAISLKLADEGVNLFLVDKDRERLLETVAESQTRKVEVIPAFCDLTNSSEISDCVGACLRACPGGIDILVNCAGIAHYGPMIQMSADEWNRLLAVNLHAPIQFTRELLPTLLNRMEAHVVNVSSMFGLVGYQRWVAYSTSKFGLLGFSESLRAEFSREGLGVTSLCPGCVDTPFYDCTPCGHKGRKTRKPPRFILTTPEVVATKTVRAIRRNKPFVLVTPLAYLLYYAKRFIPGAFYIAHNLDRRRTMKKKMAKLAQSGVATQAGSEF
ncbi:MAG: SDR family NAD(P)-dependent oxidoreductase [Verrucomicrobiales bacterium]